MTFAGSSMAADGTISIYGTITDNTCDISVENQGKNAVVVLPTISADSLSSVGATAGITPFSIALTNCTYSTLYSAGTFFEAGALVEQSSGRLNNASYGTATGVQIELLNDDMSIIKAGSSYLTQNLNYSGIYDGAVLNYFARYYANGAVTPGTVNTQVDYTIIYL
ncbi:hypothetical protein BSQ40_06170 [Serratia fonticola]|nr:hypothetical protein BSQ40_06170 [Serratia fonticola]